ncbi:hypothetical protein HRbin20_01742 [bacterium HR20]|nr:hypothetical protein HRbin20_01742 [bacterium HR20]
MPLAEQVDHHCRADDHRRITERKVANCTDTVLELRSLTSFDGVMPAVMRSRRDLVEKDFPRALQEELDAEDPHPTDCFDSTLCDALRLLSVTFLDRCGSYHSTADVVFLNGLDAWINHAFPTAIPRNNYRQLLAEVHERFDHQRAWVFARPKAMPNRRDLLLRTNQRIAIAIVAKRPCLDDDGIAMLAGKCGDCIGRIRIGKVRRWNAGSAHRALLHKFIAHKCNAVWFGEYQPPLGDLLEQFWRDEFVLECDDVANVDEAL